MKEPMPRPLPPTPEKSHSKVHGFTWTVEDVNLITQTERWGEVLVEAARSDPRIVALTADLGNTTKLRPFKEAFPDRFFNVGVAEQNLMAVASGLAATGLTPVVCTYATFAALRAAEFVRTDIAYNQRNVKIIGTLAGVAFGQGGPTHHSGEDLALLRAVPGLVVLAPSDGVEMAAALRTALSYDGPVYLRIGRGVEQPTAAEVEEPFTFGRARLLHAGSEVTVIACGPTVREAMNAAERAAAQGISVRVINMASIKPLDEAVVRDAIVETRRIVTVEDHSIIGGLGSAVAEVIAHSGKGCAMRRLGHPDQYLGMGIPEDLMHLGGFDEDAIFDALITLTRAEVVPDDDWQDAS
jgi:transketolase